MQKELKRHAGYKILLGFLKNERVVKWIRLYPDEGDR